MTFRKFDHKSEFGSISNACRNLLLSLRNFRFSFIRRQPNNIVHLLAKVTLFYSSHDTFDYILASLYMVN